MKHKTWFRLVLKAIGVLLIGWAIPQVAQHVGWFIDFANNFSAAAQSRQWTASRWAGIAGSSIQFLLGMYLLIGGKWIADFAIPSNRPYCPNCGYDLSHNTGERCSECGVTLPPRDAPSDQ